MSSRPITKSLRMMADEPTAGRILIVEDDEALCDLLAGEVKEGGHRVRTAHTAEQALAEIETQWPDVVVSDLKLPGANGMELLHHVKARPTPVAVLVITAFGSIPQAVEALKAGADDFLTKPLNLDHFTLAVNRSLENQRLRERVQELDDRLGDDHFRGIIGRSGPMRTLIVQIKQVAGAAGPVLIQGESGVGKELVARAIHAESPRADGPFVAVNCAGVPRELLESEFFGHEEGAFTGARAARKGLFVEAEGGTLLLDEVTEMPAALQAKLLRVLQEKKVRPVGSNQVRTIDVRVLASTNRTLDDEVEAGRFREDLFYRLETFQLEVPPLRQRGDDIDLLTAHFMKQFTQKMDKSIEGIAPRAMKRLAAYPFPGNVRELKNAIERAVTFCQESTIQSEHLPERIRSSTGATRVDQLDLGGLVDKKNGQLPTLDEVEQAYIHRVLDEVEGNKRRAASILGIGRRTLYRRLKDEEE